MADEGTLRQRQGIGVSMRRKEDDRHLRGRAQFVADVNMRGMQEVVFVRSTHFHAHIGSIFAMPGNSRRSRDSALQVRFCHTRSVLLADRHIYAT